MRLNKVRKVLQSEDIDSMVISNIKNVRYKEENELLTQQVEQQKTTNNQLKDMTSGDPDEEEIASIARDDLGYGYSGEQVFVDTSSK